MPVKKSVLFRTWESADVEESCCVTVLIPYTTKQFLSGVDWVEIDEDIERKRKLRSLLTLLSQDIQSVHYSCRKKLCYDVSTHKTWSWIPTAVTNKLYTMICSYSKTDFHAFRPHPPPQVIAPGRSLPQDEERALNQNRFNVKIERP